MIHIGDPTFRNPTRLDINPDHDPDVVWDLNQRPLPFGDGQFDEIHAYEVLEHIGRQGDIEAFCEEWNEYYRILKPGGRLFASVPSLTSPWLWGDPSHTRAICKQTLVFLSQDEYAKQVGKTPMSDLRRWYKGNFRVVFLDEQNQTFFFVLEKVA